MLFLYIQMTYQAGEKIDAMMYFCVQMKIFFFNYRFLSVNIVKIFETWDRKPHVLVNPFFPLKNVFADYN
jgi:hypothetical protein